jgi:hypothetical protein
VAQETNSTKVLRQPFERRLKHSSRLRVHCKNPVTNASRTAPTAATTATGSASSGSGRGLQCCSIIALPVGIAVLQCHGPLALSGTVTLAVAGAGPLAVGGPLPPPAPPPAGTGLPGAAAATAAASAGLSAAHCGCQRQCQPASVTHQCESPPESAPDCASSEWPAQPQPAGVATPASPAPSPRRRLPGPRPCHIKPLALKGGPVRGAIL